MRLVREMALKVGVKVSRRAERYSLLLMSVGRFADSLVVLASAGILTTSWSFNLTFSPVVFRLEDYEEERERRYQHASSAGRASYWARHAAECVAFYGVIGWVVFW